MTKENGPFSSRLAPVFERYVNLKRALGRRFDTETGILQSLDRFLRDQASTYPDLNAPAFQAWCRTQEKISFYSRLGVRELLIVDRQSWTLSLHRRQGSRLEKVGQSSLEQADVLASAVVPLRFRLLASGPRPQIEVTHVESAQRWLV